jgi:hypothetical protein
MPAASRNWFPVRAVVAKWLAKPKRAEGMDAAETPAAEGKPIPHASFLPVMAQTGSDERRRSDAGRKRAREDRQEPG